MRKGLSRSCSTGGIKVTECTGLEDLNFPFCVTELLLAMLEQFAAAPIRGNRLLQRQAPTFHVLDNLLQFGKCCFKL